MDKEEQFASRKSPRSQVFYTQGKIRRQATGRQATRQASYPYIFGISPCRKNAPHFSASHHSKNPFLPLSPLLQFLLLFNEYANYLYRRN
jgi:hypothetical protein